MIISSHNFPTHPHSSINTAKKAADNTSVEKNAIDNNQQKTNSSSNSSSNAQAENNIRKAENELNQQQLNQLRELRQRDREVRAHEQAHAAAAGSLAKGGPSYSYQRGPDGRMYAIGGEVQIDTSAIPGDPEATAEKARQVKRAALAPAQPSSQDRAVAAAAASLEAKARVEIAQQKTEEAVEKLNDRFSGGQNNNEGENVNGIKENSDTEVHAACPECGGKHSGESHSVSIKLNDTFNQPEQIQQKESYLKIAV